MSRGTNAELTELYSTLKVLADLWKSGALSDAEFKKEKERLLDVQSPELRAAVSIPPGKSNSSPDLAPKKSKRFCPVRDSICIALIVWLLGFSVYRLTLSGSDEGTQATSLHTITLAPTVPQTHEDTGPTISGDAVGNAYKLCQVFKNTGMASECEVKGFRSSVEVRLDTSSTEAQKICAGVVNQVSSVMRFDGKWQLRIFSPYSEDHPLATCTLR